MCKEKSKAKQKSSSSGVSGNDTLPGRKWKLDFQAAARVF